MICPLGGYEDGDKVSYDVHVNDACRLTSTRPAAAVTQTPGRRRARVRGTAGAVDHGQGEKSWTTETEAECRRAGRP